MAKFLCSLILTLFLSGCQISSITCVCDSSREREDKVEKKPFDIETLRYEGDSVVLACVNGPSEFLWTEVDQTIPSEFVEMLNNDKPIILFFHGFDTNIKLFSDVNLFTFRGFMRDWSSASDANVCIISYAFDREASGVIEFLTDVNKMVTTNRLEYVAKLGYDLVLDVRKKRSESKGEPGLKMSQVDLAGFSFGAHIAGKLSQYLKKKTGEKVRKFLALDPSAHVPFGASKGNTINKEDVEYLQVIHTCPGIAGISKPLGHVDIFVKSSTGKVFFGDWQEKHKLAYYIHVATVTKELYLVAVENGNKDGQVTFAPVPLLQPHECLVGLHSTLNENNRGKIFSISIAKDMFNDLRDYAFGSW